MSNTPRMSQWSLLSLWLVACGGSVVEGSGAEPEGSDTAASSSSGGDAAGSSSSGEQAPTSSSGGQVESTGSTTAPVDSDSHGDSSSGTDTGEAPADCGDGVVSGAELCDDGVGPSTGCTNMCAWTRSCLELHTLVPTLGNETYQIDPLGDGSSIKVYCDMDGGGWTQVAFDDFSTPMTWSAGTTSTCGAFGNILGGAGQFGKGAATERSFMLLGVPHTELRAIADVVVIDSWDDEDIRLEADGQVLAERGCKEYDAGTCGQAKNECGGGWRDGETKLSGTRAHGTDMVLLKFSSSLNEDANNEAWGVNTMYVFVK